MLFRKILALAAAAVAFGAVIGADLATAQLATPLPTLAITLPNVPSVNLADGLFDVPNSVIGPTNNYATVLQLRSFMFSQSSQHLATAPTLTTSGSGCGGSAATVNGTDYNGQIAEGSTASTSCVVTFATAYVTAPECFVSIDNVADAALKCHTTTTAMTITQTSASSNKVNYIVVGLSGG